MDPVFHSAVIGVHDFEQACENYALLLGRPPSWVGRIDAETDPELAVFAFERMHLELRSIPATRKEGLGGIRLAFPGLGARAATLADRNIRTSSPVTRRAHRSAAPDGKAGNDLSWQELGIDSAATRQLDVALVDERDGWPEASVPGADCVHHLDHVVINSAAIEETGAFYGEGLGLRLALDRTFEERGIRLLFFRIGGVTVEVGGRLGAAPDVESADRFGGLAWQTLDVHALRARLAAAGFDMSEVRKGHKAGTFVCTARDRTHGVPTLLIQPVPR